MVAIETKYNGYRFRSRLEARWAVFFDSCDIEYEYEPEGFANYELEEKYLPDFYLPKYGVFAEVKPSTDNSKLSLAKAVRFVESGIIKKLLILPPFPQPCEQYDGYWFSMLFKEGDNTCAKRVTFLSDAAGKIIFSDSFFPDEFCMEVTASNLIGISRPVLDTELPYGYCERRYLELFEYAHFQHSYAMAARFEWGEAEKIPFVIKMRKKKKSGKFITGLAQIIEFSALRTLCENYPDDDFLLDCVSPLDFTNDELRNAFECLRANKENDWLRYFSYDPMNTMPGEEAFVLLTTLVLLKEETIARIKATGKNAESLPKEEMILRKLKQLERRV